MRRSVLIQGVILLASVAAAATVHASTIPAGNYELTDATVDGYQLTGTLRLNTSGLVDAANITLNDSALGNPVFTDVNSAGGPSGYSPTADYAYISDPGLGQLALDYLTTQNTSGDIGLCILAANDCNSYEASYYADLQRVGAWLRPGRARQRKSGSEHAGEFAYARAGDTGSAGHQPDLAGLNNPAAIATTEAIATRLRRFVHLNARGDQRRRRRSGCQRRPSRLRPAGR